MNSRNIKFIIGTIIILLISSTVLGIFMAIHNKKYIYNQNGTIPNAHNEQLKYLNSIEDNEERNNQINFSLEYNLITNEEAQKLYR